jgi:putative PIN family toxin of toxin-antitoxin system
MKVFFDTNVYVAEALLGEMAERILQATERASWRIYSSGFLLDELQRVLVEKLGFSRRLAFLSRGRIVRRAKLVEPGASHHTVPQDPADSPILRAALAAGVDYLVTNDAHLLALDPYEGVRIVSMSDYHHVLREAGVLGT